MLLHKERNIKNIKQMEYMRIHQNKLKKFKTNRIQVSNLTKKN